MHSIQPHVYRSYYTIESPCHPEVVEGGDERKMDYNFVIKVLSAIFLLVFRPHSLDLEESGMNRERCEHPCQCDVSPIGVVREQSEEVDQVRHHVHSWQGHIEEKKAEKRPHSQGNC